MDNKCLELLSKLDDCIQDPEFQLILVMRLIKVLGTLSINLLGDKNEPRHSDL